MLLQQNFSIRKNTVLYQTTIGKIRMLIVLTGTTFIGDS